ncbi:hypothetical protein NJ7G_1935 [Natrinema sp. J7-2]|nr:hypothetical protein NJ7G_1935 [Natrinema sp. J7-2]
MSRDYWQSTAQSRRDAFRTIVQLQHVDWPADESTPLSDRLPLPLSTSLHSSALSFQKLFLSWSGSVQNGQNRRFNNY